MVDPDGDRPEARCPSSNGQRSELAARRQAAGWTQESLAHHLQVAAPTVRRWEAGVSMPRPRHRPALAVALQVTPAELDRMLTPGAPMTIGRGSLANVLQGLSLYVRSENLARAVWSVELVVLPALITTENYSREVERASHRQPTALEVEEMARIKLARQDALRRPSDPLVLSTVVPMHVLTGEQVDREQLFLLMEASKLPNVHLQGIEAKHLAPVPASFTLLASPGSDEPDLAVEFGARKPHYEEMGSLVDDMMTLWRHLSALAMSEEETSELLAGHLRQQQQHK
jgi:transcriptional regulator with XRE-family HTH domain